MDYFYCKYILLTEDLNHLQGSFKVIALEKNQRMNKQAKRRTAWTQKLEGAKPIKWWKRPIVKLRMFYWKIINKVFNVL